MGREDVGERVTACSGQGVATPFAQPLSPSSDVILECLGFKWELHQPQLFQSETLAKLYLMGLARGNANPGKEPMKILQGRFSPRAAPKEPLVREASAGRLGTCWGTTITLTIKSKAHGLTSSLDLTSVSLAVKWGNGSAVFHCGGGTGVKF